MNIFSRLFKRPAPARLERAELTGFTPTFTAWGGDAYANDIFRGGVDAIARNMAKLKGSHVITFADHSRAEGRCTINRMLQVEPNPYMSAYDMYYRLATHYYLHNNAFCVISRGQSGAPVALFPVRATQAEFYADPAGTLYVKLYFPNGSNYTFLYTDVIHLKRHFNSDDLLGDSNEALGPALELAHTENEGIINGIKAGVTLRGLLKFTQVLSASKLQEQKEAFVKDFLTLENSGGVVATDQQTEYTPIESKPAVIDGGQMQATRTKIYNYLGISEQIVNSSYTDDQWAAFYESVVEPFALLMGLEFTRKLFSPREQAFGNSILFESGRLQFISNGNKITLLKEIMPMGLLTVNQALEVLNLPSVPDGDRRIQSLNYVDQAHATEYQLMGLKAPAAAAHEEEPPA